MSLIKANTIKPVTSGADLSLQGDSGGSAVDCLNITSAGDVDFTGNADAKIKLPSAGGIYESDGTTPVLTESGGVVTLGSSVVFPAGHIVQTTVPVRGTTYTARTGSWGDTVVTGEIEPIYDNSAIIIHATFSVAIVSETTTECGYAIRVKKSGTGVTNTYGSPLIGPTIQAEGHSVFYRGYTPVQYTRLTNTYSFNQVDNDCETTNAITYVMQNMTYAVDGDLLMGGNDWDNLQWMIWFQEIKRA